MLKNRIIPCLDVKDGRVVKGINFVNLIDAGDPVEQAKIYDEQGADELCFLDITASNENRNIILDTVKNTAEKCFMPLTVGGGVRTLEDIRNLLLAGADKVSINSKTFNSPNIINDAVKIFGKSTIVGSVEVLKKNEKYYCYYNNGRTPANIEANEWILKLQNLGVGEIVLTFIDFDGTGKGCDFNFIKSIKKKLKIPLIISGGIGNLKHVSRLFKSTDVSGVAIGSLLHYNLIQGKQFIKKEFKDEGNIDFISSNKFNFKKFENKSINNILKKLNKF